MDLESLRCISQVNDNFNDQSSRNSDYYANDNANYAVDRAEPDLSLLTPCEFCNRTFVPASLNKHRRGCYKAWLKQKDRDSRLDREKNRYQSPVGYNGEKPILTIEQMLAKRRQRRLNWRMRHEEFMRAVHAARDYADAVASGNPLPPPPVPIMEPDLKQCPHCQRRFHEKAIERHLTRCKEQSIRNNKERPSYQTMEAKRRLAVRLYYQPSSRPNSCLSMTNPATPTSSSRPSSRQTDLDYGRNLDSPNDLNTDRYSSMSAIENKDAKNKIPISIFDNLAKLHGRSMSRKSMREYRASQNTTPTFDSRNSTPLIPDHYTSGRISNLSTFSSRNSSRQSMVGTPIEPQLSSNLRNSLSKKGDIYKPSGNIRRSTSCISQIRPSSVCRSEKFKNENLARGDMLTSSRKPFSCSRSTSKESLSQRDILKHTTSIVKSDVIKIPISSSKLGNEVSRHKSISRLDRTMSPAVRSHTSASLFDRTKSPVSKSSLIISNLDRKTTEKHRSSISKTSLQMPDQDKKIPEKPRISKGSHVHSHRSKKELYSTLEEKCKTPVEKTDLVKDILEVPIHIRKPKHRTRVMNPDGDVTTLKISNPPNISAENFEISKRNIQPESSSVNRIRNEVQIRIKSQTSTDNLSIKDSYEDNSKCSNSQITLRSSHVTIAGDSKPVISITKEIDNILSAHKLKYPKEEVVTSSNDSKRFVTNCNIVKAQCDSLSTQPKSTHIIQKDEHSTTGSKNLYQCRSIKSVSISDQNNATKYRSTISLQDSLNRGEESVTNRVVKAKEIAFFCQDCGHKFPSRDAKFCCSCGCRRTDISVNKSIECLPIKL